MLALVFSASATATLLKAYGYKVNLQAKKIQKTAILYIQSDPKDVQIYVNDQLKSQKAPYKDEYLLPGVYSVEVKKDGYQTWQKSVWLDSGTVPDCEAVLFLDNPKTSPASDILKELFSLNNNSNLEVKNDELWLNSKFVTRFSQKIERAILYTDEEHIIFQIANEIRVIDIDGGNNLKLAQGKAITNLAVSNFGRTLYFEDSGSIFQAQIR